ncbi:hypothetical protein KO489_04190 [Reinekea forsetii]|nr:hypothetical protein [Reinekea forsetii]
MSIASLRLTLPEQNLHFSRETAAMYRDVLVNQVLNSGDFEQQLEKITISLSNLNRMSLDGDTRLSLTESLINQYLTFMKHVRTGDLSLTEQSASGLTELNREFAFATKLLLRDAVSHSKEELANFVYWVVSAISEQLQDYSVTRRNQPEGLWAELNRIYQFAESRYLTDFHNNKPDKRDIESRYKQALLFQAAQPHHLNDKEQILLNAYLTKWAFRSHLRHQESREFNSRYFYVDLDSPKGAVSSRSIEGVANGESIRALNPLPIIEQVRLHMSQLRKSMSADKIGFQPNTDNIDAFMTLKKVLLSWKQESTRRFERASCAVNARTAVGLNNIHHYLRSPRSYSESLINSSTVNMSKTGACVKLESANSGLELSVGDVVMHKHANESNGRLAVVRWLQRAGMSILFGVEYIVGNLQPVTIRVQDKIAEALLISTSDNDSLITHKGYCASNTPVRLKSVRHNLSLDARVQALIQRGQHVDQIRLKRSQMA